jgi:glycosyltransferase involved in cell wall biosynthesis
VKVAIIIPRLAQLGPILFVQTLVNKLCEIDNLQITVFYLDKNVDPNIKMRVPVERLNHNKFCFSDYDIIHTNGIRPDLFAFVNRRKIRYHISTIHNFVFEDLRYTYNRFISLIFGYGWLFIWRRADKLVCVTGSMKEYYEKWFSSTKMEVIYYGISERDDSFVPENDVIQAIDGFHSRGLKVVGNASILTKRKGIDQILHFLSIEKGFALIIIGKGKELNDLQRIAKKLDVSDRCYFCGFRNHAVIYFRYFDFFVMPSRSEGLGLALIEAVQQRVPVICSDIDVFREVFTNNEVTFFKLENIDSLSAALTEAIETAPRKVNSAFGKFQLSYTNQIMADRYLRLYQTCLSS